ncbi:hypothetical protein EVAR_96251_1, partial [Eumeta japonica]
IAKEERGYEIIGRTSVASRCLQPLEFGMAVAQRLRVSSSNPQAPGENADHRCMN